MVLNESLNLTANMIGQADKLDYHTVQVMMTHPLMIVAIGVIWLVPLFIYLIVGCVAHGRSANGQATSKPMIMYPNYWYAMLIFGLLQLGLFLLLIFPIWLKFLN